MGNYKLTFAFDFLFFQESFSDSEEENAKDEFCSMCTKENPPEKKNASSREDPNSNPCTSCKRKGD